MITTNYLALSWTTSRGRDTYGYNIARLDDRATDQRYKCMGGGYDMLGTCVAQWLAASYQERLVAAGSAVTGLYGARRVPLAGGADKARISLDGACGLECMIKIAAAIGVRITTNYNRKAYRGNGVTEGYFVSDFGSAAALKAAEQTN